MNEIVISTQNKKCHTSRDLYGIFFEDINRVGDGGLYPEMLRNRSFEDSLVPEGCRLEEDGRYFITPTGYRSAFNHGEGLDAWCAAVPPTDIPAWYASDNKKTKISLDFAHTLNDSRKSALAIRFTEAGTAQSVYNIGYAGMSVQKGASYRCYMFAKTLDHKLDIEVSLRDKSGERNYAKASFCVGPGEYARYDCLLTSSADDTEAAFHISTGQSGELTLGFASLMPKDTYLGRENGVRKDIAQLLKGMNAHFMRFPGGCIVEGLTEQTAMRFENSVGPVWERPSHWLIWFYRTTNGLGFHEYLQLCEDIGVEPMYVVNCGMTCQGRNPDFFNVELTNEYLQDAIHAVEYATAGEENKWGGLRAKNGHPAPFGLKYIEIGNENFGPEYDKRYRLFYQTLKARFPALVYVSNTHTELSGLQTEITDEHFYNDTEYFVYNQHRYDHYDRSGPKIFVGEYAVTFNEVNASLYSALGEAAFLTGLERNQDIVTMSCYAPLFMKQQYKSWFPNLIVFNNHESYGIPSYYMLQMMGQSRGDYVLEAEISSDFCGEEKHGMAGLFAQNAGISFHNVKINGVPQSAQRGSLSGEFAVQSGTFTAQTDEASCVIGAEEAGAYTLSADFRSDDKQSMIKLSVWNKRMDSIGSIFVPEWAPKRFECFEWVLEDGVSCVRHVKRSLVQNESEKVPLALGGEGTDHLELIAKGDRIECLCNGRTVHSYQVEKIPAVSGVATLDEKSGEVIVKLVNITEYEQQVTIRLDCEAEPVAAGLILRSIGRDDANSFEQKTLVSPEEFTINGVSSSFIYPAPRYSLSILRLKMR